MPSISTASALAKRGRIVKMSVKKAFFIIRLYFSYTFLDIILLYFFHPADRGVEVEADGIQTATDADDVVVADTFEIVELVLVQTNKVVDSLDVVGTQTGGDGGRDIDFLQTFVQKPLGHLVDLCQARRLLGGSRWKDDLEEIDTFLQFEFFPFQLFAFGLLGAECLPLTLQSILKAL